MLLSYLKVAFISSGCAIIYSGLTWGVPEGTKQPTLNLGTIPFTGIRLRHARWASFIKHKLSLPLTLPLPPCRSLNLEILATAVGVFQGKKSSITAPPPAVIWVLGFVSEFVHGVHELFTERALQLAPIGNSCLLKTICAWKCVSSV